MLEFSTHFDICSDFIYFSSKSIATFSSLLWLFRGRKTNSKLERTYYVQSMEIVLACRTIGSSWRPLLMFICMQSVDIVHIFAVNAINGKIPHWNFVYFVSQKKRQVEISIKKAKPINYPVEFFFCILTVTIYTTHILNANQIEINFMIKFVGTCSRRFFPLDTDRSESSEFFFLISFFILLNPIQSDGMIAVVAPACQSSFVGIWRNSNQSICGRVLWYHRADWKRVFKIQ